MRRRRSWLVIATVMIALSALAPGSAAGFGTIDSGGQNREHERITRAALACAGDGGSEADCFEPRSIDLLAGHAPEFGAVGTPDKDELSLPAAHCDNIDFLPGEYPRTRGQGHGLSSGLRPPVAWSLRARGGQHTGTPRRPGPDRPRPGHPRPGMPIRRGHLA